jgi:hypothetical protein
VLNVKYKEDHTNIAMYNHHTMYLYDHICTTRKESWEHIRGREFTMEDSPIHSGWNPPAFRSFFIINTKVRKTVAGHFCSIHHKTQRLPELDRALDPIMVSSSVKCYLGTGKKKEKQMDAMEQFSPKYSCHCST